MMPLAYSAYANAVLLASSRSVPLACCNAWRVAGVVVALLYKVLSIAIPFAMLPKLPEVPHGHGAIDACF